MTLRRKIALWAQVGVGVALFSPLAFAQAIGDTGNAAPAAPTDGNNPGAAGSGATVTTAPSQTTTTTYAAPYGLPAPGTNVDAHLPSSSRSSTDASSSQDGFDYLPSESSGAPIRGGAEGPAILGKHGSSVPALHQVARGDTLWDLCSSYFQNPWLWPKIWSYNPQIQNPHWIYPGDQVRLRTDIAATRQTDALVLGNGKGQPATGGFLNRRPLVPRDTVFLRDTGYIDDPKKDVWGELVGAEEEQMLLTEGDNIYVIMRPGVDLKLGQLLTLFHSVRTPAAVTGARRPPGEIIAFTGTMKVDDWNPNTRMARGQLIESLDTVERGDKVGPVGRRFDIVPPRKNDADLEARVLTSMYPHEIMGQNQIVFIDRGAKDGLAPGNRLFLIHQGDNWRRTLETTTEMARTQVKIDDPEHVKTDVTPLSGKTKDFPEELAGELRVLRADDYSSVTLVTSTKYEIEPGDRVVARKGY
jgi:hypothetical protein